MNDAGLEKELLFSKGSRVMITRNLWSSSWLVNGTMETIFNMIWKNGVEDPFGIMPAVKDKYDSSGEHENQPSTRSFCRPCGSKM